MWGLDEINETKRETQLILQELVEERDYKHYFYLAIIGLGTLTFATFALGMGSSDSLSFWKTWLHISRLLLVSI